MEGVSKTYEEGILMGHRHVCEASRVLQMDATHCMAQFRVCHCSALRVPLYGFQDRGEYSMRCVRALRRFLGSRD